LGGELNPEIAPLGRLDKKGLVLVRHLVRLSCGNLGLGVEREQLSVRVGFLAWVR
jgi:hypothetical protein